jgi:hypothetical protein
VYHGSLSVKHRSIQRDSPFTPVFSCSETFANSWQATLGLDFHPVRGQDIGPVECQLTSRAHPCPKFVFRCDLAAEKTIYLPDATTLRRSALLFEATSLAARRSPPSTTGRACAIWAVDMCSRSRASIPTLGSFDPPIEEPRAGSERGDIRACRFHDSGGHLYWLSD